MENKSIKTLNIYQKLLLITEEADKIPKRGENKFSNYKYVMAVDVIGSIRELLVKHGVHVSISEVGELKRYRDGKNFHCETNSIARFTNIEDPKDYHEVRYFSVAADTLDKDIYKAKTGGLKYLFSQEFKIITDDFIDPETSGKKEEDAGNKTTGSTNKNPDEEKKKTGGLSDAQWKFIVSIGKNNSLSEPEVISLTKWVAGQNKIEPRHWKIAKLMLGEDNFKKQLDKYLDSQII